MRRPTWLLIVLVLVSSFGCGTPPEPEPETSAEMAARGKMMRAMSQVSAASFAEDPAGYVQAIATLRESLAYDPNYHRANAMMALVILQICNHTNVLGPSLPGLEITPESARPYANTAINKNPKSVEGWSLLAMICVAESDFAGAKEALAKAKSASAKAREYYLAYGDYLYNLPEEKPSKRANNIVNAAASYLSAIEADPEFGIAYMRLLDLYEAIGDLDRIAKLIVDIRSLGYTLSSVRSIRYRQKGIM
ncbi:MAG: hypothetical protein WC712_01365 [Candidatus Brocadiia bacterium]